MTRVVDSKSNRDKAMELSAFKFGLDEPSVEDNIKIHTRSMEAIRDQLDHTMSEYLLFVYKFKTYNGIK